MPREARIAASDAAAMPFPREETTPPVTNTNLVMGDKFWKFIFYITGSLRTNQSSMGRVGRNTRKALSRSLSTHQRQHGIDGRRLLRACDGNAHCHHYLRRLEAVFRGSRFDRRANRLAGPVDRLEHPEKLGQRRAHGLLRSEFFLNLFCSWRNAIEVFGFLGHLY